MLCIVEAAQIKQKVTTVHRASRADETSQLSANAEGELIRNAAGRLLQWARAAGGEGEGTAGAEAEGASSSPLIAESSWGRRPARAAGNGLDESFRKFAACRRKYLIRHLELLARTGNFASLAAAQSFLSSPTHWPNPAMMADLARWVAPLSPAHDVRQVVTSHRDSSYEPLSWLHLVHEYNDILQIAQDILCTFTAYCRFRFTEAEERTCSFGITCLSNLIHAHVLVMEACLHA